MQEIECPICKAAPLECYTVCVPCFDSLRDSHAELLEACEAFIERIGPGGYYPVAGKLNTDAMRAAIATGKG